MSGFFKGLNGILFYISRMTGYAEEKQVDLIEQVGKIAKTADPYTPCKRSKGEKARNRRRKF